MTTIMPTGDSIRKAVKWIDEEKKGGRTDLMKLIDEAGMNFNLSPKDSDFLIRFFKEEKK